MPASSPATFQPDLPVHPRTLIGSAPSPICRQTQPQRGNSITLCPFDQIATAVAAWPGITTGPGRFGATTFLYGTREVGHLHGDRQADLPFPTALRHELVAAGKAQPHHDLPMSGWVSQPITSPAGIALALDLFALNYDLIARKKQPPEPVPPG